MGQKERRARSSGCRLKAGCVLLLLMGLLVGGIVTEGWAAEKFEPQGTAWRKLQRGGSNLLFGWMEFLYHFGQPDKQEFLIPWMMKGLPKGIFYTVRRELVGVYEVLSFPFPAPADYLPIIGPEFPWEYSRRERKGERTA